VPGSGHPARAPPRRPPWALPADELRSADAPAPAPTAAETPVPIVAITVDDTLLHIAPADDVLAHLAAEAGRPGALDPQVWEFFAKDGTVLTQQTDPGTGAVTLEPDPAFPTPAELDRRLPLDRMDSFLARAQVLLTRDLQTGIAAEHVRVPRLTGDLPDVVTGLAAVMTVPKSIAQPDSRDWIHNLGHRF
jgi:hypothetical protein